jgi:hypothetical protein
VAKWSIQLPYRDRDAKLNLAEIADDVAESITDPEEQAVARALGMELVLDPDVRTYGDAREARRPGCGGSPGAARPGPRGRRVAEDRSRRGAAAG